MTFCWFMWWIVWLSHIISSNTVQHTAYLFLGQNQTHRFGPMFCRGNLCNVQNNWQWIAFEMRDDVNQDIVCSSTVCAVWHHHSATPDTAMRSQYSGDLSDVHGHQSLDLNQCRHAEIAACCWMKQTLLGFSTTDHQTWKEVWCPLKTVEMSRTVIFNQMGLDHTEIRVSLCWSLHYTAACIGIRV